MRAKFCIFYLPEAGQRSLKFQAREADQLCLAVLDSPGSSSSGTSLGVERDPNGSWIQCSNLVRLKVSYHKYDGDLAI